jgi:hypothetical protein
MGFEHIGPLGLWNRFRDDWIVTRLAAWLFFFASTLSIAITPLVFGYIDTGTMSRSANFLWNAIGALAPFAVCFIWTGMWRYWARIDHSHKYARRFWFLILLCGLWFGASIYYFLVFLPQYFRRKQKLEEVLLRTARCDAATRIGVFGKVLIGGWFLLLSGTLLVFLFPKSGLGTEVLFVLSLFLILSTAVYGVAWLYRVGISRDKA